MHYFIDILNVVYSRREGSKGRTYAHFLPNTITLICILKACSSTWTLYRGKLQKALKALSVRVVASKNALSSGYYQQQATLNVFEQMQNGLSQDASPL